MSMKMRGFAAASLLAVFAMLSGCAAGPTYRAMDPALRAQVTANHAVLGIGQPELIVDPPPMPVNTFGLIGALVGTTIQNSQAKSAENSVIPLRNSLLDFDFDNQMQSSIQTSLSKVDWLHVDKVTLTKQVNDAAYNTMLAVSDTPYLTFTTAIYHISHDMKRLQVDTRVGLFPKTVPSTTPPQPGAKQPDDMSNARYWVQLYYVAGVSEDEVDAIQAQSGQPGHRISESDAAVTWWSKDNGAKAKAALTQAIADINQMMVLALQSPYVLGSVPPTVQSGVLKGHIVSQQGTDRAIVQFEDGSMQSLPMSGIKPLGK